MIDYKGKPLEHLTLEETIEFEKQMLKRVLSASKAQMSGGIIDQINLFIDLIRDHKTQITQTAILKSKDGKMDEDGTSLEIGGLDLPPDAESIEEMLDFYKKK
jgi:hypothetical protein